jgi:O-antigen/teichoic acid export membrane protein
MGRYDVAQDVATSPSQELMVPMVAVLFPVMATIQEDKEKRRTLYLNVLYLSGLICASTSVGMALVSSDLVDIILGPQWVDVKPLMPWLALSYGILGLSSSVYSAFDTLGRPVVSARLQWLCVVVLFLVIFPVAHYFRDLEAVAIARFVLTVALAPALFYALGKALDVPPRYFAATLWRPFAAALAMAMAIAGANAAVQLDGMSRLAMDIGLGASVFAASLLAFWSLSGRPQGPEQIVCAALHLWLMPLARKWTPFRKAS